MLSSSFIDQRAMLLDEGRLDTVDDGKVWIRMQGTRQ